MSFYLGPPSGRISLENLERFAEKRLDFLIQIFKAKNDRVKLFDVVQDSVNVTDSECLIDGSKKDGISHFILRLALCSEVDTTEFFISAETTLFEFRFLCMNEEELRELFRNTEKSVEKGSRQNSSKCSALLNIFEILKERTKSWKKVVKLYLKGDNSHYFHVPFYHVLNFVAKRQVVLSNGIAAVPFPKMREIITNSFKEVLEEGMKIAREKRCIAEMDLRMKKLLRKLVILLRRKHKPYLDHGGVVTNLSHDMVSMEMQLFPPCMYNLYEIMEDRHRLRHNSRIQFTLFLKEIGMPVHEALMYWRTEYSIAVDNQDGCHHDWKNNEKRYIYNIRHLYGLEGSRINYRSHCCSSLQNFTPFTGEVGGCPFKHFDRHHLNALLDEMGLSHGLKQEVDKLVKDQDYSEACLVILNNKMLHIIPDTQSKTTDNCQNTDLNNAVYECQRNESCTTDKMKDSIRLVKKCSLHKGISPNAQGISPSTQGMSSNTQEISLNAQGISPNAQGMSSNAQGMSSNAQGMSSNAQGVSLNTQSNCKLLISNSNLKSTIYQNLSQFRTCAKVNKTEHTETTKHMNMDIDEILDADGNKSRSDILLFSKYSTGEEDHSNNEKCDKCSGMLKTVGMHTKSCECSFIVLPEDENLSRNADNSVFLSALSASASSTDSVTVPMETHLDRDFQGNGEVVKKEDRLCNKEIIKNVNDNYELKLKNCAVIRKPSEFYFRLKNLMVDC